MALTRIVVTTSSCSLLLIYRPRKDERLSWPSWLTYSGRFTHTSGHPSAVGRVQDSESSPVKDQRSTAEPRNQPSTIRRRIVLVVFWLQIYRTYHPLSQEACPSPFQLWFHTTGRTVIVSNSLRRSQSVDNSCGLSLTPESNRRPC